MSTAETGALKEGRAIAQRIKGMLAQRRMTMRELAEATGLPYRTLQDYLLGTTKIPAPALGRIAQTFDVATDWLILGREPTLDKESLALVLEYFDEFVQPQLRKGGTIAGVDAFIELYRRIYLHQHSVPGVEIKFVKGGTDAKEGPE